MLGPFVLQDEDLMRLQEIATGQQREAPFGGMQIDYVWQHALLMFDYTNTEEADRLRSKRRLQEL